MDDEKSRLIDSLAEAISNNPQAEAVFNALIPDEPELKDETKKEAPKENSPDVPDISSLIKMQSILSAFKSAGDDDRSRLLFAIKPFLSEDARPHVDSAVKLLKVISLLKLAGELDLFKDFKL